MKKRRDIFFNLTILLIMFFCSIIYVNLYLKSHQFYPESLPDTNVIDDRSAFYVDSSDEGQMVWFHILELTEQPLSRQPELITLSLPDEIKAPVWRPPEIL